MRATITERPAGTLTTGLGEAGSAGCLLRQVTQAFSAYHVSRNSFVTALEAMLGKDDERLTLEFMVKNDVLAVLCCPLVQDPAAGVQAQALGCLAQLAAADPALSAAVMGSGVLESVVASAAHEAEPVQAAADAVLQALSCSDQQGAQAVVDAGAVGGLVQQLERGSPLVQLAASKALTQLAAGSQQLAQQLCAQPGLMPALTALLLSHSTPPLLRAGISACLTNMCSHDEGMARAVAREGCIPVLAAMVAAAAPTASDVRAAGLSALAQLAKHSAELAQQVVDTGILAQVHAALAGSVAPARRAAAALLLELAQQSPPLAEACACGGGAAALVEYLRLERGQAGWVQGLTAAGHICSFGPQLAQLMLAAGLPLQLAAALPQPAAADAAASASPGAATLAPSSSLARSVGSPSSSLRAGARSPQHTAIGRPSGGMADTCSGRSTSSGGSGGGGGASPQRSAARGPSGTAAGSGHRTLADARVVVGAAAWATEQAAGHCQATCEPLVAAGLLPQLVQAHCCTGGAAAKVKAAVKALVRGCADPAALQALLQPGLPLVLARHVLARLAALLADSPQGRQALVTSGALQRLLALRQALAAGGKAPAGQPVAQVGAGPEQEQQAREQPAAEAEGAAEAAGAGAYPDGGQEGGVEAAVVQLVERLCALFPAEVLGYFAPPAAAAAAAAAVAGQV